MTAPLTTTPGAPQQPILVGYTTSTAEMAPTRNTLAGSTPTLAPGQQTSEQAPSSGAVVTDAALWQGLARSGPSDGGESDSSQGPWLHPAEHRSAAPVKSPAKAGCSGARHGAKSTKSTSQKKAKASWKKGYRPASSHWSSSAKPTHTYTWT